MYSKPPYQITSIILKLIQDISQKIGEVNVLNLDTPPTELRKKNRIKSIHSSLSIEGNSLSLDQVSSILENKRVLGPINDIIEVKNAIKVYKLLQDLKPTKESDLLRAHKVLMNDLIPNAGQLRNKSVGILKGDKVEHIAPPAHLVQGQIKNLLTYLKDKSELTLIKGCVFHYEFEFIHPFEDGNGRMGRLWQTLILMQEYPVFEFIPVEHMIKHHQQEYYNALAKSDKVGHSTHFIEYMLTRIDEALAELLEITDIKETFQIRIEKARKHFKTNNFSRKDYMKVHKKLSTASASRELKKAVDESILEKSGDKRNTTYKFK